MGGGGGEQITYFFDKAQNSLLISKQSSEDHWNKQKNHGRFKKCETLDLGLVATVTKSKEKTIFREMFTPWQPNTDWQRKNIG